MTRIVLDTNVLISAILNPRGKPALILKLVLKGIVDLVISPAILQEMRKVIHYPKLVKLLKKNRLSIEEVENFLNELGLTAIITPGELELDIIKEDMTDNKILACAVEGRVGYIISGDQHLLRLKNYGEIEIFDPATFLKFANIMHEDEKTIDSVLRRP